ncbi:flagellin [Salinibacter sp.]|uniref:flagellin N-terminal helical domain-containing protein n=1 Tax=Salinibacter sp. TaxID=2065818 RepID=UPI0021E775D9|nr:flagellin [Salinibacter sp.]
MSSAFQINTNIQAQKSLQNLQNTNDELSMRRERLSTGLRINSAEDDAAGFEIAAKLEAKTGGQEQASRNITDAKSMLSVAEGGLDSQLDILQEMKGKVVQAANDSLAKSEREAIQGELDELTSELNDIAENTSFNDRNLLNNKEVSGTSGNLEFQTGAESDETFTTTIQKSTAKDIGKGVNGSANPIGTSSGNFNFDLNTGSGNTNAIKAVDGAIDDVTSQLSNLGATQNRLSFKQENLETSTTNLNSAQSQIEDVDFAKEQTEVAKLQVLQQSGTAQLAQANASGQSVLSLLG